jgi:hypothetical protein
VKESVHCLVQRVNNKARAVASFNHDSAIALNRQSDPLMTCRQAISSSLDRATTQPK